MNLLDYQIDYQIEDNFTISARMYIYDECIFSYKSTFLPKTQFWTFEKVDVHEEYQILFNVHKKLLERRMLNQLTSYQVDTKNVYEKLMFLYEKKGHELQFDTFYSIDKTKRTTSVDDFYKLCFSCGDLRLIFHLNSDCSFSAKGLSLFDRFNLTHCSLSKEYIEVYFPQFEQVRNWFFKESPHRVRVLFTNISR